MAAFVQLTPGAIQILPGRRMLKADEYQSYADADAIVAAARARAAEIERQAQRAFEDEKRRGFEEGVSEAKEEMAEQMFMNVSQSIDYFAGIERDVAKVVIQAVRKILGEFDDDELTIRMVRNALGAVRNQQQITLRIAPGLVEQVKERVHELLSVNTSLVNVQVVGDARLGVGDCLLESELGVVEASLESQIHALEQAMARRLGKQ